MAIPELIEGVIPLGRWVCTRAEVRATFATNARREKLWSDWEEATEVLRRHLGEIPSAWISGSFVTDKDQPGDIDSVYLVDVDRYLPVANNKEVAVITHNRTKLPREEGLNLEVDTFILEWDPVRDPRHNPYHRYRGYWDDFWQRMRDPDNSRLASLPRRGYLEVVIDGYG